MPSKFLKHHLFSNSCEKPDGSLWRPVAKTSLAFVSAAILMSGTGLVSPAQAAGFYIQEQSVQGLGSAFSGTVSNLDDPSTVYYNPAGMTKLKGTQAQLGVHLLLPDTDMTDLGSTSPTGGSISGGDGGNPFDPTPVPNGYLTYEVGNGFWAGLGISAPFGLGKEYNDDWFGRFDSTKSELVTLDFQPTIAYEVSDSFSIGGGVNIQYADADLENALFAGSEGTVDLEGDDWSYGYTLGFQYRPFDGTTFGASYRSSIFHTLEGDIVITGTGGADRNDPASADLDLPDIATFGAAHELNNRWTVQGQATWFGWNNFQDIDVEPESGSDPSPTVQNYQTTWSLAIGAEYDWNEEWTFRGGVQYDETPTTDQFRTTRTPDGDRTWLSLGASYNASSNWEFDFGGTYVFVESEDVDVDRNITAFPADVKAEPDSYVGILSAAITYKF